MEEYVIDYEVRIIFVKPVAKFDLSLPLISFIKFCKGFWILQLKDQYTIVTLGI